MPKSHEYAKPSERVLSILRISEKEWGEPPPTCPHCKQQIKVGDKVHTWEGTLWHTKPCPSMEATG